MGATPNPRAANGHRRRTVRARVLATENICALCGEPVDKSLKTPHPMSPEVDEIIPVSRGGSPIERRNCQLAHRICNQRKGNGNRRTQPLPAPDPFVTSREW